MGNFESITIDQIEACTEQFTDLSTMNESLIVKLFKKHDDDEKEKNKGDEWFEPLYKHMVRKFEQCGQDPIFFIGCCDPINKEKVFGFYGLQPEWEHDLKIVDNIVRFFDWSKCMMRSSGVIGPKSDIKKWEKLNCIDFYLQLDHDEKNMIIKKYNDYHDKYNE